VSITLEENSEPNVTLGEESKTFTYNVKIRELTSGKKYVCLRYDSEKKLPKDHVYAEQAVKVTKFTAHGTKHEFDDSVESNEMVFYRCIEEEKLK